jgi:hypothetical protein
MLLQENPVGDRLIKTAELDGIGSNAQALPVPGPMTITDSPPCKCHFCARSITEAYLHAEFHEAFGRGGHVYEASCPDCDVEYTCRFSR